jgi:cell division protein FtsA
VFSPLAASEAVLDRQQRELGVAMVDFGGMTTNVAVYEEGELLHSSSFAPGSSHITNDIAIGLRTSVEIAEQVKLEYGTANLRSVPRDEDIRLSEIDPSEEGDVSRYHIGEIIEARLEEILENVERELKSADHEYFLPSGIVLCGGGANLAEIAEKTKASLALPVFVGYPRGISGVVDKADDPAYAVATGLLFWQLRGNEFSDGGGVSFPGISSIMEIIRRWLKMFLP